MKRIIKITPGYDKRETGYGIHGGEMFIVLKGNAGAVILTVSMGWYLPETSEWKAGCIRHHGLSTWEPHGVAVSYCSPKPLAECDTEPRENCEWIGCTCYGDTGYTRSKEPFELLLRGGTDAVWPWLENFYNQTFNTTP